MRDTIASDSPAAYVWRFAVEGWPIVTRSRLGSRSLARQAVATSCARCGEVAPRCDECLARLVSTHRDWAGAFGRQWGRFVPLSRTAPRWDNAADRALALRMVKALRLDDDRAREALAQIWIEAGAAHLHARQQRRAAAAPPQRAPEVVQSAGGWLITLSGRPYTRSRIRSARWRSGSIVGVAMDGGPCSSPATRRSCFRSTCRARSSSARSASLARTG